MERFGFFTTAPEQERITALEPHNTLARPCALNQQAIDPFLWGLTPAPDFADINQLGRRGSVAKQFRVDQIVIDDNVAGDEQVARLDSQKRGVARSSADKIDNSRLRPVKNLRLTLSPDLWRAGTRLSLFNFARARLKYALDRSRYHQRMRR